MDNGVNSHKIQVELVKLLYQQISPALWAEAVVAVSLVIALWGVESHGRLISWLIFILFFSTICRQSLVYYFNKYTALHSLTEKNVNLWLYLFMTGVLMSGISWGIAGTLLMVKNDILRQSFTIFILMGLTSAANPLYSPIRGVYAIFIVTSFVPFAFWLMIQNPIFMIIGLLALIYVGVMLALSFYLHQLITTSLQLRFANLGLVEHLSAAKNSLENRSHELEHSLSLTRATLESTADGIVVVNEENNIEDYNQKFIEMWELPEFFLRENKDIRRMTYFALDQLQDSHFLLEKIYELQKNPEMEGFEELHFKDGRVYECYSRPQRIGNKYVGRVWSFRDVTGRKSLEAKLFHQANFDSLTQLPNRSLLLDRISQAIILAKQAKRCLAVFFLDLDRFKIINDTLGHLIGDKLLKAVAKRLVNCVRETDTVSREGGDEFIIILTSLVNANDCVLIARKIINKLRKPFAIDGNKFTISISIGITFYPKDGSDPETLIKNADIAMYRAKEVGRNNFQFFTEEMNTKALTRITIENKLREALDKNELTLFYQPIVDLKSGKIIGVEGLLRWSNPELGMISPREFIPIAEESELILPIGEWVINTAFKQIKEWQTNIVPELYLSLNFSGTQFKQAFFYDQIINLLCQLRLNPETFLLELTESALMTEINSNIKTLTKIKNSGMLIALDDFGVGYSSLNYLKKLPIDKVKINRSFIKDIPYQTDDSAITIAMIALAHKLHIKVIAEGVENEAQLNFLLSHHCDEMQGYYFSEPLPAEDCAKLLFENKKIAIPDRTPV